MYCIILILILVPLANGANYNCSSQTPCSCNLKGVGNMNLTGVKFHNNQTYVESFGFDGFRYRYYPCGAGGPWGNGDCKKGDTTCQYTGDEGYFSLGTAVRYVISQAVSDKHMPYVSFSYYGGTKGRASTVEIICDPASSVDKLQFMGEYPTHAYNFKLNTVKFCPNISPLF
ncbi:hypothetical protein LOD99_5956 [Oopsacas minuta]|uniref:MRH domain-containing protein n=1 Tax=Oopsacas minuta TaxID=111878 RepID=A0AAV7JN77_9METZ|nr:hypothetical protein LOD99_5956 [Oopsacas minuta]